MKRYLILLLCPLILFSGCKKDDSELPSEVTLLSAEAKSAYTALLDETIEYATEPEGGGYGSYDENSFAVYDIDLDGKSELIIEYVTAPLAGNVTTVYDYDSETGLLHEEIKEFIGLTFFDNGAVKAELSHSSGYGGGNFWPYSLYKYDKPSDTYKLVGTVDAWDGVYIDSSVTGRDFPKDIDNDGDGFVYYISDGASPINYDKPVDNAEYEAWIEAVIGDAEIMDIPFLSLTREHIAQIH